MTFAVHLRGGRIGTVDAYSFDFYGEFVRFYWLDEDGGRRDVALIERATVLAVSPAEQDLPTARVARATAEGNVRPGGQLNAARPPAGQPETQP